MRPSLIALAIAFVIADPTTSQAQRCDRQCLGDFITTYLDAMVAHDPERLHVSSRLRFTEDTVEMKLGEGLWKTVTALRPYRQDFLDVREGVAGTHTVVEENGRPVLLALRLKVFGLALSEVETSCENMKAQTIPKLAGLTYRVVAVDEEMGVVWLRQDFGAGSVPGGQANMMFSTFEAFKVYGGKIHAAEAILEVEPVGTPSGWDPPRGN